MKRGHLGETRGKERNDKKEGKKGRKVNKGDKMIWEGRLAKAERMKGKEKEREEQDRNEGKK